MPIEIKVKKFLFHTGSIKSFNLAHGNATSRMFLFHTGSIKRIAFWIMESLSFVCFYSILVRLKVPEGSVYIGRPSQVSIPYWFD